MVPEVIAAAQDHCLSGGDATAIKVPSHTVIPARSQRGRQGPQGPGGGTGERQSWAQNLSLLTSTQPCLQSHCPFPLPAQRTPVIWGHFQNHRIADYSHN